MIEVSHSFLEPLRNMLEEHLKYAMTTFFRISLIVLFMIITPLDIMQPVQF
jgi:hypothetical protein